MAHYLPMLLASVSTHAPDDNSMVVLPRGQVDYLSHEWTEEDVWRSWRNMTRQKNEIANGVRLENASWRTWWKQRNKLKTVTPETLNWLKDSDVTWLYGPLHTAVEWTPPPKPKPDPTEVGKLSSAEDRLDLAAKHKPILKYRSITEFLQSDLPLSPVLSPPDSEDEAEADTTLHPTRPPLLQTKSAPYIHPRTHPALRKPSPPRVPTPALASSRQNGVPRRHITFNTFVEQCIAVDSPRRPSYNTSGSSSNSIGEDSDANGTRAAWNGRTSGLRWAGDDESDDDSNPGNWASESALSSDSDDDVLEVCLSRSRSNSSRESRSSRSPNGARPSFAGALSKTSTSKTIAPIAPARLKTTGVGNGWEGGEWVGTLDEGLPDEVQHLLPRNGAAVNLAAQNMLSSAFDTDDSFEGDADAGQEDEVFTHRSAYFSADGVYDYLGGPDLGVEFGPTLPPRAREEPRGRRGSTSTGAEILEIEIETEGAAPSPLRSRSKSRSKSRSRSRTPSPAILSSSPNGASGVGVSVSPSAASPRSPAGSLLSPPPRGRDSSQSSTSSSASQGRGRSATRTSSSSSLSDRERSRSSHTSPLGSLSPEYGGVRVSADYGSGGYAYVGLVKGIRRGGHGSVSPEGGASVSPEKGAPASVVSSASTGTASTASTTSSAGRDATASSEGGDSTSNSGSSGATATRPRVEVNGVRTGAGRVDGEEDEAEYETRGRGMQVRNPQTPANSPVVRISREPLFVSPAYSIASATSSSGSTASVTPPGSQATTPQPPKSAVSSSKSTSSPKKPTSPTSKSIPISPPRTRPVNGALPIEEEVPEYEYGSVPEETDAARRGAPTPANSPVVRVRVPPRIPQPAPPKENGGAPTKPAQSTAKSIPGSKPAAAGKPPVSPARATFQPSVAVPTAASASAISSGGGGGGGNSANNALQRSLVSPSPPVEEQGEPPTIVGKAVGIVSTAGAYFGLWSGA